MKHLLLLNLMLGLLTIHLAYGYEVPTDVQKKNLLLEEFTGVNCGNCPDGHEIASTINNARPESSYIVAIHSGDYADTNPDYRTDAGEELDAYFEAPKLGYPCGMINRRIFDGESLAVFNRGKWIKSAKAILQEDALVNLLLTSSFDATSKTVSIQVEGYCPMDIDSEVEPMLSVLWTQSNIIGPQNGANTEYNHKHMLRGYVTPTFGEAIDDFGKGKYFQKTYNFTLPSDLKDIEVKPEDIEIIAFVSDAKGEILNVTGGKPSYVNYEKPLAAELSQPKRPMSSRYGYNFFEFNIRNLSNQVLYQASFDITMNGEVLTSEWTGEIAPFSTKEITAKVSPYTILNNNNYSILLKTLNGETITSSTPIEGDFAKPVEATSSLLVSLQTDLYADENRFYIKDADGNVIRELGPYESNIKNMYEENVVDLEKNQIYCFEIQDEWGDGINQGQLKIYTEAKKLVAQEYNIRNFGIRCFFRTSLESSIDENQISPLLNYDPISQIIRVIMNLSSPININLYTSSGTRVLNGTLESGNYLDVSSLSKGIYLLQWTQMSQTGIIKLNIQ